jgi:alkanesulfonate monooxygenase SsuD/methylene tetrahydromethanopterin reductase-like flavin-dependent oxidoreductase (luciferase family)
VPLPVSRAFAPSIDTPAHVQHAEDLGYDRAWLYDSPALYHDVFMTLARTAERPSGIRARRTRPQWSKSAARPSTTTKRR